MVAILDFGLVIISFRANFTSTSHAKCISEDVLTFGDMSFHSG